MKTFKMKFQIAAVLLAASCGLVRADDGDPTGPSTSTATTTMGDSPAILKSEFIYEKAPYPSCHASTIVETSGGLVAAWFGGTRERAPDVCIYVARHDGQKWLEPVKVADGIQADGTPLPTWNPVLFQPRGGPLQLYYKVGPAPKSWWGMMVTSTDNGQTWSKPTKLPDGILGPIKNKAIQLSDGTILSPSSTEDSGWKVHMEMSSDNGATWTKTSPLNDGKAAKLVQPTVLDHGNGNLQALCRSGFDAKGQKKPTTDPLAMQVKPNIYELWSHDNGKTWDAPKITTLPNPNSGIDAVQLKDGRSLVVYNDSIKARNPVNLAISADGREWKMVALLEKTADDAQLSYPAIIQTSDGLVHITYTWERKKIRHVVVDPAKLN